MGRRETWLFQTLTKNPSSWQTYKTQYEQLKQRCALLEEESALLRRERSYKQNQLDAARETLSKSTSELAEVEGLIAHYQNKLKELHATIATSREQAAKLGDIVAKLDERETLASTTLDALVRRRDKVKVVFEGIQRSLIDATPERVSSLGAPLDAVAAAAESR
ncbi:hypothetical protein HK105_201840 [Polyrhizophydium stewartii]|uniref:Uncharacterized protein n=1 Tax=Polyrhizophydium stewartii TaxID=2732419 RepID=A0ABR4NG42_9FUNG